MSKQQENVIREKRTIEATKKNFMGPSGKLGTILQAFGSPVIRQGTGLLDTNYLEETFEDFIATDYSPTMSEQEGPVMYRDEILNAADDYVYNDGLVFDGLSRGIHLDITYWHATNEIKVSYKGYIVYNEIAGELFAYAPFAAWEDQIERLYRAAKNRVKEMKKNEEIEFAERVQAKKKSFWQHLQIRWGI